MASGELSCDFRVCDTASGLNGTASQNKQPNQLSYNFAIGQAFSQLRHTIFGKFGSKYIQNLELWNIADKFNEPVPDWTVSQA